MRLPNRAVLLAGAACLAVVAPALADSYFFRAKPSVEPPVAFAFAPAAGQVPGAKVESSPVRLKGFAGQSASVAGGEYQICAASDCSDQGATWLSVPSQVAGSDVYARIRLVAAAYGQVASARLTVGADTSRFEVGSRPKDTVPDTLAAFSVNTGIAPNTATYSAPGWLSGFDETIAVSVGGTVSPEYRICAASDCSDLGGQNGTVGWTNVASQVEAGRYVQLRHGSPATFGGTATATLTYGGLTADMTTTTVAQDTTPDTFAMAAVTGAQPSVEVDSASVTPSGFTGTVPLSVAGGQVSVAGGPWSASTSITVGQSLRARVTSAAAFGQSASATVTLGTGSPVGFTVQTRAATDLSADAIADFAPIYGAASTDTPVSEIRALANFEQLTLLIGGGSSPSYRVCSTADCSGSGDATAWTTAEQTVTGMGKHVQVRMPAGAAGATRTATLTYGDRTAAFQVETPHYAFASHTFTTCSGTSGPGGAAIADCQAAYNTVWESTSALFAMGDGVQYWTVPQTGTYTIRAAGAQGGNGNGGNSAGGPGRVATRPVDLAKGTILAIVVPRQGSPGASGRGGGGGGGAFVYAGTMANLSNPSTGTLYISAGGGGGGGGGGSTPTGCNAHQQDSDSTIATCARRTPTLDFGPGGIDNDVGAGGMGWRSTGYAGGQWVGRNISGQSASVIATGGYGGGGYGNLGGGGGGGYSGGGGGNGEQYPRPVQNVTTYRAGTGGGSGGSSQSATAGFGSGNATAGYVTITRN
jgi:hypothetical protein